MLGDSCKLKALFSRIQLACNLIYDEYETSTTIQGISNYLHTVGFPFVISLYGGQPGSVCLRVGQPMQLNEKMYMDGISCCNNRRYDLFCQRAIIVESSESDFILNFFSR